MDSEQVVENGPAPDSVAPSAEDALAAAQAEANSYRELLQRERADFVH
jgi:hypothetical protein